jgi:hypothetical protein
MMNSITALMLCVFMGAVVLMVGFLIFRDSERSFTDALRECLFWGTGFFVAMSVQVLALS